MVAIRKKVGARGHIRTPALPKGKKVFAIDLSTPMNDGIFDDDMVTAFEQHFATNTKLNGVKGKLGDKVKITVMFRGREQSRPEMGYRLLQRLAADVSELGVVESNPKQDGRNMVMVIAPHKGAQTAQEKRRPKGDQAEEQAPSA